MENTQLLDPKMIKEAKLMAGDKNFKSIPFIPVITINNKEEDAEVDVQGVKQKVRIPPKKGFVLTTKDESSKEYHKEYWKPSLEGVILKERYRIRSKWSEDTTALKYHSFEFDSFNERVDIYSNNEVVFTGNYQEIKDRYATEQVNSFGKHGKTFDLFLILYLNIDGEIKKFEYKMTGANKWFEYKNSFGTEDTYVAYKTKFELEEQKKGIITYYVVNYIKGEPVNLSEQLELQRNMQMYFASTANLFSGLPKEEEESKWKSLPESNQESAEVSDDEMDVKDIPF